MLYLTYQKLQNLIHETEKSLSASQPLKITTLTDLCAVHEAFMLAQTLERLGSSDDKLELGLTAKIRILAETMCQYPFRVLVVRNGLDYRRTVLSSVSVSSGKDLDALVLPETDLELCSVCYDAPENRIIVNYREKYPEHSLS